jgi:hypothetical protein
VGSVTKSAIDQLGMQAFAAEMKAHAETYEHIGEVPIYAYCLRTMWDSKRDQRRIEVKPEDAWITLDREFPAAPPILWDYFNDPELRRQMLDVEGVTVSGVKHGRMGVGTIHHCAHGTDTTTDFLILDWRPFEYQTVQMVGVSMDLKGYLTMRLTPTSAGTRMSILLSEFKTEHPVFKMAARLMRPIFRRQFLSSFAATLENLGQMVSRDHTT